MEITSKNESAPGLGAVNVVEISEHENSAFKLTIEDKDLNGQLSLGDGYLLKDSKGARSIRMGAALDYLKKNGNLKHEESKALAKASFFFSEPSNRPKYYEIRYILSEGTTEGKRSAQVIALGRNLLNKAFEQDINVYVKNGAPFELELFFSQIEQDYPNRPDADKPLRIMHAEKIARASSRLAGRLGQTKSLSEIIKLKALMAQLRADCQKFHEDSPDVADELDEKLDFYMRDIIRAETQAKRL